MEFQYEHKGERYSVNVIKRGDEYLIDLDNKNFHVQAAEVKKGHIMVSTPEKNFKAIVSSEDDKRYVFCQGQVYRLNRVQKTARFAGGAVEAQATGNVTSPISGKVVKVNVQPGADAGAKQDLLIIEAMKMEYRVKAPFDGTVKKVHFKEGDQVDIGELLVEMDEKEGG